MAEIVIVNKESGHDYFAGSACAFGVFDGLHLGHQFLIDCAKASAGECGGKSIALTFDKDPDEVFNPQHLQKLMTNEVRLEALSQSGVDMVAVLPFTDSFAALAPLDFLEKTFNGYAPQSLHVGADFRFGTKALGGIKELQAWGKRVGTQIDAHELESVDGSPISSTRIRGLLRDSEIRRANELLGHPYFLAAEVIAGRGQGADLGFRTANLRINPMIQALGDGVYAAWASVDNKRYKSAVAVGVSPMFQEETIATCEAHLLDFSGEIYGKELKLEFVDFLRPMIRFNSEEELIQTVLNNISWIRENL